VLPGPNIFGDTATVYTAAESAGVVTYAVARLTGQPCKVLDMGSSELTRAARLVGAGRFKVLFPGGTVIYETDRIVSRGLTLNVVGVRDCVDLVRIRMVTVECDEATE
jgi:hypothetical protein